MRKILISLVLLPLLSSAHGVEILQISAGTRPGSWQYPFELAGEWFDLNLLTLSTRQKQAKKLNLAEERLAEFLELLESGESSFKLLRTPLDRYEKLLRESEDMAEKIVILDGREIGAAEVLEARTRRHEEALAEFLEEISESQDRLLREALAEAMLQNEKVFKFMVKYYQFNAEDIKKHQDILEAHLNRLAKVLGDNHPDLAEARKFQKAGLNLDAYDFIKKAKSRIY